MPTSIDELQIEINAKAVKANDAIDRLVGKLNGLTTSLGKLNTSNLNGLANGVQKLGNAMQVMNTVKTADFTRLARNLSSMGNINTQGLNNTASSLSQITRAMNNIGAVSHNAVQLSEMAKNLSKFGGANVQRATVNIPLLANELRKLMITLSSAPNVSRNIIDMTNALANLSTQGSKVGSASRSIQRSLNGTHSSTVKASKGFNGLASAIGKFYASYFMVIRGVKGIWSSINTTADYVEAFNYYTVSFGKIASKWDKNWENYGDENARNYSNSFVTTMNDTFKKLSGVSYDPQTGLLSETGLKNLGLNLQEVTQFAAQLGSMMDAVGHSGETTLATTNAFVRLAGDISSLYNIDYSEAAGKLRSVLQGQSRAGYGFGWDTTMASLQATADELNLSKAVSEMSQMEKQQLRILTILNQSRVAYGDQSNTINTLANQLRLLKNNIKEASMMLGQLFVPILSKLIPIINGTSIAIKRLLSNLASIFGIKIEDTGQGFTDMKNDAENLEDTYDDLAESIKVAKAQLLGFDEVNKLQDTSATATVDAEMGGIDLTDEILKATSDYEKIWQEAFDKMEANSNKWADGIGGAFDKLATHLEPITKFSSENFENFYNSFLVPLATWTVGKGLPELADIFDDFVDRIDWDDLADDLNRFYKAIEPFVEGFGMGLLHFLDGLTRIGSIAINGIGDALGLFGIALSEIDVDIVEGVGTALGILVPVILSMKAFSGIGSILSGTGNAISGLMKSIATHPYAATAIGLTTLSAAIYSLYEDVIENTEEGKLNARAKEISTSLETISTNLTNTLAGIEGKYQYYDDMASEYLELSGKYDTLSDEDKNLVKQYADELSTYSSEITGYINDITGEWEGTNEQLLEAIKNTREYYKAQAYEKNKIQYYEIMAEAELGLVDLQATFEKGIKQELEEEFGESFTLSTIDLTSGNGIEALRSFQRQYRASSNMYKRIGQMIEAWETYNGTIEEAEDKIVMLDDLIGEIDTPELNVDTSDMESGTKNAVQNVNSTLGQVKDVKPQIDDSSAKTTITDLANRFKTFVNQANSQKVTPAVVGSNAISVISSITAKYNSDKSNIENNKIKPTVNSSTATSQSNSLANTIKNTLSKFTATVSVKEDSKSLSSLKTKIGDMFSKMQIELSAETVGGKVLATFKKIAGFKTGGFPEDGLFFANHNELVGQFSNGKTAVANNEQITQGIAQAVAPAVYSAVVSAMQNTQRGNSDVVVNIDGKQVFKAVQRQANDYTVQTGLSPFNI